MPRSRLRRCTELLAVAVLLAAGAPARADEPDVDSYKDAVARGTERFAAGDYAEAKAEFEQAYVIHPAPVLLFNIASCHRRLGDQEAALAAYQRFVAAAPADDARLSLARETITHLEAILAERAEVAAERARVDERRRSTPPPRTEPAASEPEPPPGATLRRPGRSTAPPAAPPRGKVLRRVGIGVIGAGVLALAAGAWQASRASAAELELEKLPEGAAWDADQAETYQEGRRAATRALALGIGGAALAAGGVALYVVGRRMDESPRRITVSASLAPGRAGLVLGGRF